MVMRLGKVVENVKGGGFGRRGKTHQKRGNQQFDVLAARFREDGEQPCEPWYGMIGRVSREVATIVEGI